MYNISIIIVTCISPPQFIKLKTVKRKGDMNSQRMRHKVKQSKYPSAVQRPTCANLIRRMAVL
ncbi:hypothetical protein Hanom_Chr12g01140851 [Helianthus anomalus]